MCRFREKGLIFADIIPIMKKSIPHLEIQPEQSLQVLVLQFPPLIPILYQLGLHVAFGDKSVRDVAKEHNWHETVLISLLEVCIDEQFKLYRTLPAYGVLQLCDFCRAQYPYILDQTDKWKHLGYLFLKDFSDKPFRHRWVKGLDEAKKQVFAHFLELRDAALPHANEVYELYYSPDYTAGKSELFSYSMDFFPAKLLPIDGLQALSKELEQCFSVREIPLSGLHEMYQFCYFVALLQAQDRLERQLLKPLVMQMEDSIVSTLQKKKYWSPRRSFLSLPEEEAVPELLSVREREVLQLVAQGFLNKEIADRLTISQTTVISHRKHIVEKLGIHTLAGLTVYAYTHGYLDEVGIK
jgi:DNA-binding CsgD family transcriptional regulator